jgi:hypothetical protein
VTGSHVLVTGHPFVDVWAGVRPQVVNLSEWSDVPRSVEWKQGIARLGVAQRLRPRLRNRVRRLLICDRSWRGRWSS